MDTLLLGPVDGLFALVALASLGVRIWALVDVLLRPADAFPAAGKQTKTLWIVLTALGVVLGGGIGLLGIAALVVAIVYLVDVRPAVREVRRGGGSGPYGPW